MTTLKRFAGALLAFALCASIIAFQKFQLPHLMEVGLVRFFALRLLAVVLYLAAVGSATARVVERAKAPITKRLCALAFGLLVSPALLESMVMFVPRSHGNGAMFASVVWYRYYWGHVNGLKYRDREIDPAAERNLRKVLVVGDSFTAGVGANSQDVRFSGVLARGLGPGVRVYNAGNPGSDTTDEFNRLVDYPVSPDLVILQYYGNDIERRAFTHDAAGERFADWPAIQSALTGEANASAQTSVLARGIGAVAGSPAITWCRKTLFTCNFVAFFAPWAGGSYIEEKLRLYARPAVWDAHAGDLRKFVIYSHDRHVPLVVLVFPFLLQPNVSRYYTAKVGGLFRDAGVPVVDLTDDVTQVPAAERVVNSSDAHPSVRIHHIAGERLLPIVTSLLNGGGARSAPR